MSLLFNMSSSLWNARGINSLHWPIEANRFAQSPSELYAADNCRTWSVKQIQLTVVNPIKRFFSCLSTAYFRIFVCIDETLLKWVEVHSKRIYGHFKSVYTIILQSYKRWRYDTKSVELLQQLAKTSAYSMRNKTALSRQLIADLSQRSVPIAFCDLLINPLMSNVITR